MELGTKAAVAVSLIGVLVLGTMPVVAADPVCSNCGPGADWIDSCAAGTDAIAKQDAVVGIDIDLDCISDMTLRLLTCGTDLVVVRGAPAGGTIATEIVDLCLTNGNQTMIAGAGLGQGGVLSPTVGTIVEQVADNTTGDSTFGVMFEFDLGGGNYVYNHDPLVVATTITCVPPSADYIIPSGCTPLFDDPIAGTLIANLVLPGGLGGDQNHRVNPIPTVSEWGVVVLLLLVMGAGTVIFRRIRTV